jgi:hypothetical protein
MKTVDLNTSCKKKAYFTFTKTITDVNKHCNLFYEWYRPMTLSITSLSITRFSITSTFSITTLSINGAEHVRQSE